MRFVIAGTGIVSSTYVHAIAEIEGSELVGCISRSGRSPEAASDLPSWPDLDSVSVDYDAAIVATPNGLHCEDIVAAANQGKHVITEKPLGVNREEMDQAIAACEAAGVTLAVSYQHRTAPDNRALKSLIDQGAFGTIFAADLAGKFYRDQAYYDLAEYRGSRAMDGGGAFTQQLSHNLDIYTWFFGLPDRVLAVAGTFAHEMEAEDHGAALLQYANGMIGTVVASTVAKPGYAARLEVHTSRGSFTLTNDVITKWDVEDVPNPSDASFDYQHDGATSFAVGDFSAHLEIIRDFERAVETGGKPIVDAHSARATTELICRIYEAAEA